MKKPQTVLALNPGSRYLSLAVLKGTQLTDWRVKRLYGGSPEEITSKAKRILATYLERYEPTVLAIKKLDQCRSSPSLDHLTADLTAQAKESGVEIRQYRLRQLERFFTGKALSTKKEMAERIVKQYPDLWYELNREKAAQNPYHIRLFIAVALAALCGHELDNS